MPVQCIHSEFHEENPLGGSPKTQEAIPPSIFKFTLLLFKSWKKAAVVLVQCTLHWGQP